MRFLGNHRSALVVFAVLSLLTLVSVMAAPTASKAMTTAILRQTIQCQCGKTKLSVDATDPLRLVCYCRDCRGYYNTLNHRAAAAQASSAGSPAPLDPWGGCDYTHLVDCGSLRVTEGAENLQACKIRDKSLIRRVYANCCYTPLFSVGGTNTCLLNTLLLDEANRPPVRFRILGRQAVELPPGASSSSDRRTRPNISWSVPFAWFWTMPRRLPSKDHPVTFPLEFPKETPVLTDFKEG